LCERRQCEPWLRFAVALARLPVSARGAPARVLSGRTLRIDKGFLARGAAPGGAKRGRAGRRGGWGMSVALALL